MRHPFYSFLLVFMVTIRYGQCARLRAADTKSVELSRERALVMTITTSDCGNIHQDPFKGMLTLSYEYVVDTVQGAVLDMAAIEKFLLQAVVSSLSICDSFDRPMYAIQLTTGSHKIAPQVSCDPAEAGNGCHVITGYTIILLDGNVSGAKALAYDAIVTEIANLALSNELAPNVASARFSKRVLDTFTIIPSYPKADGSQRQPVTSAVAVAVASTVFFLVSIFVFGVVRRRTKHKAKQELVSTPIAKSPHLGIKRATYNDEDLEPTLFRLAINSSDTPSTTWSVSDLTSEGSTRSGYSRTASTLEKIEEETLEDIDLHSDDLNEQIHEYGPSPQHSQGSYCIENFDAIDRHNANEGNGPQRSMLSVITQSLSQEYNEDEDVHTLLPEALAAEGAAENEQNDKNGPSQRQSQGSESHRVETLDAVHRDNTIETNSPNELLLSIATPSFSRGEDQDQDVNATLLEELTSEEAELMLIDILSPFSANSSLLAHDLGAIVTMENEAQAPELDIPNESASEEMAMPSGAEGVVISSPQEDDDFNDSEQPTPTEHNPSADDCPVRRSEENTVAVPTSTRDDDNITVSSKDMLKPEQPKQPVTMNEHSMVDNSAAMSGDKEDATLPLGIAEARSFEDPTGTNMVGGDSIDESLARTAYTTDSERSLDGWIALLHFQWSLSEKPPRSTNEPAIPE